MTVATPARPPRATPRGAGSGILRGLLLAVAAWTTGACSLVYQDPSVRIADVRVGSLGLTSGSAIVNLEIVNPNRFGLEVRAFEYRLDVEEAAEAGRWSTLAEGSELEPLRVEGGDTARVALDVPFEYRALGSALRTLLREGTVAYRFLGDVRVDGPLGEVEVPFDTRGLLEP